MRTLAPAALLVLLVPLAVLGFAGLARGEDPAPAPAPVPVDNEVLLKHVQTLQREVAYLRAREAKTTPYLLKNTERADALKRMVAEMRSLGFTAAANPAPARERLLSGLDALAEHLKKDLPVVSSEESQLLDAVR